MWHKLLNFFRSVLQQVVGFLSPLAREIAVNGGKILLQAAAEAVIAAEQSGGNGEEKRKAAVAVVKRKLADAHVPIVLNAVHGAIEAAVARMNAGR